MTIWQAAQSSNFWHSLISAQGTLNDWVRVLLAISILASFWDGFPEAVRSIRNLRPDMNALVLICIAAASGLGEWQEGATVAFLFSISHHLEAFSLYWTSRSIRHGETIIYSSDRGSEERWIGKFARIYTPVALTLAALVVCLPPLMGVAGGWRYWIQQGMVVLLISCPCALVIAAPVTFSAAITSAARAGIRMQSSRELEAIAADSSLNPAGYEHARNAMNIVRQNVSFAVSVKLIFLVMAMCGAASVWIAVLADTGAIVAVTLNGLRMLRARVAIPA